MKRLLAISMAMLISLMLFAGCTGGEKPVTINLGQEPPDMCSITTTSTGSMNVLRHLVDGLITLDQKDSPVAGVAESWTVSEDGRTYNFVLRQDYKWTNGEPVTAKDFVFAWDMLFTADTGAEYAGTWAKLVLGAAEKLNGEAPLSDETRVALDAGGYESVGYKVIDDYNLQVTTTAPYPYFLAVLAFPSMLPVNEKAFTEAGGVGKYGTEVELLCTNGAFKMTEWVHENSITMEKNVDYAQKDAIKINQMRWEMISDSNTAYNSHVAGDLDMVGITGDQLEMAASDGLNLFQYDDASCWYFEFNHNAPGLNNVKIREALTKAVDVDTLITSVLKNNSTVANCFTPPAVNGGAFAATAGDKMQRFTDYTQAKALLDEGLAEENMTVEDLELSMIGDEGDSPAKTYAYIQEQWRTVLGVEVAIEQMTYQNRLERMTNKDFTIVFAGWAPDYNDPMTFLDLFVSDGGNNHTSYASEEYDSLIAQAMAEPDAAKRQELLLQVEDLICTEFPVGPVYNRARDYACSDRLTGVVRTGFQDINMLFAEVVE